MKSKFQFLTTLSIVLLFFTANICYAQCTKEKELVSKYTKMADGASSWDIATPAILCSKYYKLVCDAKTDTYSVNDKSIKRNQQEAIFIEEDIKKVIEKYNKESNKLCGTLKPVKAIYKDSIGEKQEDVVGYWITKEFNKYHKQTNYPIFAFFNGGNFKVSLVSSFKQKSSWKKIANNKYQITQIDYSIVGKTWNQPRTGIFEVNTQTNTAVFSYTNSRGEQITSTWYYKGKVFSLYKKSESEILSTVSVTEN